MTLLRITANAALPLGAQAAFMGPELRILLDPSLGLAAAAAAVRLTLREHAAPWVIAAGRAVAPFLSAVASDLSLGIAGAFLLSPKPWSGRPLDLAPLPFPAALVAPRPDAAAGALAAAWGAVLLDVPDGQDLLADPRIRSLVDLRARSLARAVQPGSPYAAVAGTAVR